MGLMCRPTAPTLGAPLFYPELCDFYLYWTNSKGEEDQRYFAVALTRGDKIVGRFNIFLRLSVFQVIGRQVRGVKRIRAQSHVELGWEGEGRGDKPISGVGPWGFKPWRSQEQLGSPGFTSTLVRVWYCVLLLTLLLLLIVLLLLLLLPLVLLPLTLLLLLLLLSILLSLYSPIADKY